MMQVFDTRDQGAPHRFGFWHDIVCRTYARCDGMTDERTRFIGRAELCDFGSAQMTQVASGPIEYLRSASDLRRDQRDDMFLAVMLNGDALFTQNDRSVRQRPGDVLIYDSGRPYRFRFETAKEAILLRVSRAALQSRLLAADGLGGTVLRADGPCGAMAAGLLRNGMEMARAGAVSAAVLPSMIELLAATLAQGTGATEALSRGDHDRLARVKRWMLENMANDALALEGVAVECGVSLRTLSRLFAREGTTPMRWLQQRRLAAARSALVEGRARSVTGIAFAVGFNDLSHFGRVFKAAYGQTPREAQRRDG